MSKDELKSVITRLELGHEMENLLLEMVDQHQSVDQTLLNAVADILETQAACYDKAASIFDERTRALNEAKQKMLEEFTQTN